jgi:hypothetical protein
MLASSKLQTIVLSSPLLGVAKVDDCARYARGYCRGQRRPLPGSQKSASLLSYRHRSRRGLCFGLAEIEHLHYIAHVEFQANRSGIS